MSDRIAVMFDGKIAQVATPQMLYGKPCSRRVGNFIGMMNFLEAKVLSTQGDKVEVDVPIFGQGHLAPVASPRWGRWLPFRRHPPGNVDHFGGGANR